MVCRRVGGSRIKHRVKQNWLKMVDKAGLHAPSFLDGSGAFNPKTTVKCMDGSAIGSLAVAGKDLVRQDLACVANRYNDSRVLGLTDGQRVDLVDYLSRSDHVSPVPAL